METPGELESRQRKAMLRRLERLAGELERVKGQRNALALALAAHTGRTWVQELAAVGVDLGSPQAFRSSPFDE